MIQYSLIIQCCCIGKPSDSSCETSPSWVPVIHLQENEDTKKSALATDTIIPQSNGRRNSNTEIDVRTYVKVEDEMKNTCVDENMDIKMEEIIENNIGLQDNHSGNLFHMYNDKMEGETFNDDIIEEYKEDSTVFCVTGLL